jgi:hypothetical protein
MNVSLTGTGVLFVAWLALAIPTVVYLAGRKTDTRQLTVFWGIFSALLPPIGLLFILAMLLKDDRPTT